MSEKGVAGASMRSLAGACELNVATLYHHFPSKADVFRAVIEERGFAERFRTEGRRRARWVAGRAAPAADRLVVAGGHAGGGGVAPADRREPPGRADRPGETSVDLVAMLEQASERSLVATIPELADRSPAVARAIVGLMFALIVEHLALGPDEDRAQRRIDDLVQLLV